MSHSESLLEKVASKLGEAPAYSDAGVRGSILTAAASSYGSRPTDEDLTQPTGFDPSAAALFEAVVESAFLVANADGDFDAAERSAFQHVVLGACGGMVAEKQVSALLEDLAEQLDEDGLDKRIAMVARTVSKPVHAREVLRISALLAHVSGGVSDVERDVMTRLTLGFGLELADLEIALGEAASALAS